MKVLWSLLLNVFKTELLLLQFKSKRIMKRKDINNNEEVEKLLKRKKEESEALRKMLEKLNSKSSNLKKGK